MLLSEAKEILKKNGYHVINEAGNDYSIIKYLIDEYNNTGKLDGVDIDEENDKFIDGWVNISNNAEEPDLLIRFYKETRNGETFIYDWKELDV